VPSELVERRPDARAAEAQLHAATHAEQTYQQAVILVVQARANRYADTAALFQALGGSVTPEAAVH
jgi:outer membrane protein TolC